MWTPTRDNSPQESTRRIAKLAERQHGVVTREQLLAEGVGSSAIAYRLRVGRLQRVHPSVYAVGHRPPGALTSASAAVLAAGPGALLSHRSAAALWGFQGWPRTVDVSGPARRRVDGVTVHRVRHLEGTRHLGIPVTTPARTLLDLADVLEDLALARVVNEALVSRRVGERALLAMVAGHRGRRGAARLRGLVRPGSAPTRSALEDRFLALIEQSGLPRPQVNVALAGQEVDMLWAEAKLVVELDGRAFHDTARAFERDRERDAALLSAGYRVLRITPERLRTAPGRELGRLATLLARAA